MNRHLYFLFFTFFFFLTALALKPTSVHSLTMIQKQSKTQAERDIKVNTKLERFFDMDKNKKVSLYERALIRTYEKFKWPLAKTKKKKKFDFNGDLMLQPYEHEQYLKYKKKNRPEFKILPFKQQKSKSKK